MDFNIDIDHDGLILDNSGKNFSINFDFWILLPVFMEQTGKNLVNVNGSTLDLNAILKFTIQYGQQMSCWINTIPKIEKNWLD